MDDQMENCPLRVSVRIRPSELINSTLIQNNNDNTFIAVRDKPFVFDQIFNGESSQKQVYEEAVQPYIKKLLDGYSCTVLAYGQTGTGKTYTMLGNAKEACNEHAGIITRAVEDIFADILDHNDKSFIKIEVSFIEIYNQKIYDLLKPKRFNQSEWIVRNLKIEPDVFQEVKIAAEAQELLAFGMQHRHTGETKLNTKSSRSHAIFTVQCTIHSCDTIKISKLNLVDLAGSESIKRTGNEGVARLEGISINKSLLTLRQVLMALSKNDAVVPYRDSILTTVLHDSLRIKNYIILLACVSSNTDDYFETLNTLRFADSTKQFKSKPEVETILNNMKLRNPDLFDKWSSIMPVSTPMKRKHNYTISTPMLPPKRIPLRANNTFSPLGIKFGNQLVPFANKKSTYSVISENADSSPPSSAFELNDANLSSSTVLDIVEPSYSPIVSKCTEAIEKRIQDLIHTQFNTEKQKRRSSRLLHTNPLSTPSFEKYQQSMSEFIMKTIDRKIDQLLEIKLKDYTEKSKCDYFELNKEKSFPRKLFDEKMDPKMECETFKVPQPVRKTKVRASLRISKMFTNKENIHLETHSKRTKQPPKRYSPDVDSSPCTEKSAISKSSQKRKNNLVSSPMSQHTLKILHILNAGSQSDLQLLSTIGRKTAYQIKSYRDIKGPIKSIKEMQNMPFWRGQQLTRFLQANNLPDVNAESK